MIDVVFFGCFVGFLEKLPFGLTWKRWGLKAIAYDSAIYT